MEYYVYILYSKSMDKFYKGQTSDIISRLKRHNEGREEYTRDGLPWILLWYTTKPNRSEAVKFEMKLKNLSRERLMRLMLKYDEDIMGPDELLLMQQLSGC